MRDDVIGFILRSGAAAPECAEVATWWPRHRQLAAVWRNPMDRAIAGGFSADRAAWAFASGYQAALHALLPAAPEDRICAFCVTEADGNAPRAIKSSLVRAAGGWTLNGAKRWTTLGPSGALFFVAARDEAASAERPALKMALVPSDAAGVEVQNMPATRFVPEVPHAQLRFVNVALGEDALLPGDGYERYVKPFRTVEDLHVNAAIVAYLLREARRLAWPQGWVERAAAHLQALRAIAAEDASQAATHVALAGALANAAALLAEAGELWKKSPADPAAPRWERDRELLGTAGKARAMRTQRAWERLSQVA
ncbi:MAG: acyl-CoA dehydrogenase [Betaproteobacteria bacterium]|nr:acyl-CoA dehydrogenase [Betaproteobacteria bacterium]